MLKVLIKTTIAAVLSLALPLANADHHGHLKEIIDARSNEAKARDQYRHPMETLQLFGIKEGMTVIDALPGSWYGDIIAPLIGKKGKYIGVAYGKWFHDNRFGDEADAKWEEAQPWLKEWPKKAKEYGETHGIEKLTARKWTGTEDDAWAMAALAVKL